MVITLKMVEKREWFFCVPSTRTRMGWWPPRISSPPWGACGGSDRAPPGSVRSFCPSEPSRRRGGVRSGCSSHPGLSRRSLDSTAHAAQGGGLVLLVEAGLGALRRSPTHPDRYAGVGGVIHGGGRASPRADPREQRLFTRSAARNAHAPDRDVAGLERRRGGDGRSSPIVTQGCIGRGSRPRRWRRHPRD